jgi:hypothetical protein
MAISPNGGWILPDLTQLIEYIWIRYLFGRTDVEFSKKSKGRRHVMSVSGGIDRLLHGRMTSALNLP